jgi:hypothetical protein
MTGTFDPASLAPLTWINRIKPTGMPRNSGTGRNRQLAHSKEAAETKKPGTLAGLKTQNI